MTRGEMVNPPAPGKATAGRSTERARPLVPRLVPSRATTPALALALALVLALIGDAPAWAGKKDGLPDGVISEVKIEGNVAVEFMNPINSIQSYGQWRQNSSDFFRKRYDAAV